MCSLQGCNLHRLPNHKILTLRVVNRRPLPTVNQEEITRVVLGDSIQLSCTSVGDEPAPILSWVDENDNVIPESQSHPGDGKYDVVATANITMTPELVGKSFGCSADFSNFPTIKNQASLYFVQLYNEDVEGNLIRFNRTTLLNKSEEL